MTLILACIGCLTRLLDNFPNVYTLGCEKNGNLETTKNYEKFQRGIIYFFIIVSRKNLRMKSHSIFDIFIYNGIFVLKSNENLKVISYVFSGSLGFFMQYRENLVVIKNIPPITFVAFTIIRKWSRKLLKLCLSNYFTN